MHEQIILYQVTDKPLFKLQEVLLNQLPQIEPQ